MNEQETNIRELILRCTILEFNDVLLFGNPLMSTEEYIALAKNQLKKMNNDQAYE